MSVESSNAEKSRYMGGEVTLATAPNGSITNTEVLQNLAALMAPEPKAIKLADGVYSIVGLAAFNVGVIEGDTGLIIYDTGDSMEDGQKVLDFVRTLSDKPITGLIYSHSHYAYGARAILVDAQDVPVVGHPNVNSIVGSSAGGATFGIFDELAPLYMARAAEHLSNFVPDTGLDELRTFVQLPAHLREFPQLAQIYGEVLTFPPRIYYEAVGWFDRDAANISLPSPHFEAERIVAGFGGRDPVITAVKEALEQQEFAWAARLVNHLYRLDPLDEDVRALKAQALREMGQRSLGSIPVIE